MPSKTPALVFSPGAWHTPEYFEPTTSRLREAGFTCDVVSLPCVGAELTSPETASIPQSFDADVLAIRAVVTRHLDAGRDVVLVVHSYSGVVGSEAVAGLDAGSRGEDRSAVTHLVYAAALVVDVGVRLWPTDEPPFPDQVTVVGDLVYRRPENLDEIFYSRCSPAQRALAVGCLRGHAWKAFTSPATHAAWRVIPSTYVRAKDDTLTNSITHLPDAHRFEAVVEVDGDHFPFVTAAEQMAEVIAGIAERSTRSLP
ncbi:alpha/beta-hydrolase [Hypoxylon cercidicola]|nr:alpha/beta-hydrolase [Hypoxylon cercidicola]